jgi:hypothetical protein
MKRMSINVFHMANYTEEAGKGWILETRGLAARELDEVLPESVGFSAPVAMAFSDGAPKWILPFY